MRLSARAPFCSRSGPRPATAIDFISWDFGYTNSKAFVAVCYDVSNRRGS
jgi:hypothetical protein